jgi:hypothetical protein
MLLVLLQPGVNQKTCLPNINLTTFTGDTVYFWCLQFQVILDRVKETIYFLHREAHHLEVVPRQHPYVNEYWHIIKQESK